MDQTKNNILSTIRGNQKAIKSFGVKRIGLFGSFVREEQDSESDIDLLVEFDHGKKTFHNFIELSFFLEELFKARIELVTAEAVSPYLKPYIMKEVEYVSFGS